MTNVKPHVHNDIKVVYISLYTVVYTFTKKLCFYFPYIRHTMTIGQHQIKDEVTYVISLWEIDTVLFELRSPTVNESDLDDQLEVHLA